ncbi:MAG: bifunctional phosphoribosylaminoimidazolecarboxamide formyltransferase/IMP cyclohydrolase, partial [bacterium]
MGIKIRNALISVWDKNGASALAKSLKHNGTKIYSTGGTAKALIESGVEVIPLDSLTGFTELIGGRVKTLHPKVFAGILANRDLEGHMEAIAELEIPAFDLIAVNLYPFEETLAKTSDTAELVEMIDIGGVALLRAAAKNHSSVITLSEPDDYRTVIGELEEHGEVSIETSKRLAGKAFRTTSYYDALIANTLDDKPFPKALPLPLKL